MADISEFIDTVRCCDCLDGLRELPDNCVDLTVTSPPYDNLRTYNGNISQWSFEKFQAIARELYRVTKKGGVVVWVVADATINGSETGTSFRQALYFKDCGFNLHDTMIYAKHNPVPVGGQSRYYQSFEYMFVFSKVSPKHFHALTEAKRNACNDKRTHRYKSFNRGNDGEFVKKEVDLGQGDPKRRNVWTYLVGGGSTCSDNSASKHPAVFPQKLAADHIRSWSNEGDIILDPFLGSGTTALAAAELNIKDPKKVLPLVQIGWDEELCGLEAQYLDMLSPTYSGSFRDGCWFCHNQGVGQLRSLRKNYPELWALLMKWDLDSPVSFHADGHTVHDFDRRFQLEDEGMISADDNNFKWSMLDSELNYRLF